MLPSRSRRHRRVRASLGSLTAVYHGIVSVCGSAVSTLASIAGGEAQRRCRRMSLPRVTAGAGPFRTATGLTQDANSHRSPNSLPSSTTSPVSRSTLSRSGWSAGNATGAGAREPLRSPARAGGRRRPGHGAGRRRLRQHAAAQSHAPRAVVGTDALRDRARASPERGLRVSTLPSCTAGWGTRAPESKGTSWPGHVASLYRESAVTYLHAPLLVDSPGDQGRHAQRRIDQGIAARGGAPRAGARGDRDARSRRAARALRPPLPQRPRSPAGGGRGGRREHALLHRRGRARARSSTSG